MIFRLLECSGLENNDGILQDDIFGIIDVLMSKQNIPTCIKKIKMYLILITK